MSILDLPRDEFLAMLPELRQQGVDTDALLRQYRSANSPLAFINEAATASQSALTDEGRRAVAGGLLSKPEGATGMDAVRGLDTNFIGGLLNMLSGGGRAVDAPMAAAQGLIPQGDMALEALGTAGAAMTGGGAATVPRGSLRAGFARDAAGTEGEQMARRILDMRAAGRASEVTDDMMAQADPQVMFNETPLPMDAASRAARAEVAGFDMGTPMYHGSGAEKPIDSFNMAYAGSASNKPNERAIFTTESPDTAGYFANYASPYAQPMRSGDAGEGQVLPVTSRGETRVSDYAGTDYDPARMTDDINATRSGGAGRLAVRNMRELFDFDEPIDNQVAVMDPRNIRSQFARFDPEFAHLSNLSAANASPTAGLLAMPQEQDKKELPFMALLKGLLQ